MRRHREDVPGGPFNDLQCRQAGLGGIFQELVDQLLPEFSVPGAFFRQGLDSLHDELRRPAGQIEHGSGGHPESVLFSIEISRNGFLIAFHRNLFPFQNIVESGNIKCNKGGVNRRMRRYRHRGIPDRERSCRKPLNRSDGDFLWIERPCPNQKTQICENRAI